jgi:hypothetical protein
MADSKWLLFKNNISAIRVHQNSATEIENVFAFNVINISKLLSPFDTTTKIAKRTFQSVIFYFPTHKSMF